MRMDRYFLTTPRNELLTRHTFFFKDPQTLNEHFLFFSFFFGAGVLEFWSTFISSSRERGQVK